MSRRGVLILAAALLAAAGLGVWFEDHFERRTERVGRGFTGEARRNPFLAAEHFLRRMGVEARGLDDPRALEPLPPTGATLIIPTERSTLGGDRARALLDWVERGGHLIVRIKRPSPQSDYPRDPLLDALGVSGRSLDWEEVEAEGTTVVEREGSDDLLELSLDASRIIELEGAEPSWEVGDPHGLRIVEIPRGRGRVTVLSDTRIWENGRIDAYAHARFLYVLARRQPGAQALILRSDDLPPLWRWLWRHAPGAVATAALLLIAWLLRAPRRFGPPAARDEPQRRRLLEHIEASGHYLWKHGPRERLVETSRDALMQRVRQARPELHGLPAPELARRLAAATGTGARAVERALVDPPRAGREGFTRQIQIIESIRKRL